MSLSLMQLFSTDEKCLPFGRQALAFTADFSLAPSYTIGPQMLSSTRPFTGIKGMFLQGSPSKRNSNPMDYSINNVTNVGGSSNYQILRDPRNGTKYYVGQFGIKLYGSGTQINRPAITAGYTYQSYQGTTQNLDGRATMGPDGNIYMLAVNTGAAAGSLMVVKINPQTGALISSMTITATNTTINANQLSAIMKSDGTLFVGYILVGAPNASYVVSVNTTTMTVLGTFTGATHTNSNVLAQLLALDSNGNCISVLPTGFFTYATGVFALSSLAGSVYTGTISNSVATVNLIINDGLGLMANQNGDVIFTIFYNNGAEINKLQGPTFLQNTIPGLTQTHIAGNPLNNPVLAPYSNTMEKGFKYFYVMSYLPDANNNLINFQVTAYDANTLQPVKVYTLPFGGYQTIGGFNGAAAFGIDADTQNIYLSNTNSNNIEYAILGTAGLTITINGTGQQFQFASISNTFSLWLPLMCLPNDTVTLAASNGYLTGYLTNYDIEPFLLT